MYWSCDSVWIVVLLLLKVQSGDMKGVYTNVWAVEIEDGHEKEISETYGFSFEGKIFSNYHLLRHRRVPRRSGNASHKYNRVLYQERHVRWFEQQLEQTLDVLQYSYPTFTDETWKKQWYLNRIGLADMNVLWAWQNKYTGAGVVVSVVDDGVQSNNIELKSNYYAAASYDAIDDQEIVTAKLRGHGTKCAGVIAADANNGFCGVGVAFNARIGGIRATDGNTLSDAVFARAFSHTLNHTEIYSCSWGPRDSGDEVGGPGSLTREAFRNAVTKGRKGLGAVIVFSGGNGGNFLDNCAYNGYVNSMHTIAINSVTLTNDKPAYAEKCSAILASTYSSDIAKSLNDSIITPDLEGKCASFSGTSVSAAMASGIIALVLQANKKLTWRDVHHLIVRTSRHNILSESADDDWFQNNAGWWVSSYFGFGLMDAGAMVKLAKTWNNVPKQKTCVFSQPVTDNSNIPSTGRHELSVLVNESSCKINILEYVQLQVNLEFNVRGHLEIFLTSPHKTRSNVLPFREFDFHSKLKDWTLLSVQFWGEEPKGLWNVSLSNRNPKRDFKGNLFNWTLILTGTVGRPGDHKTSTPLPPSTPKDTTKQKDKRCYKTYNPENKTELTPGQKALIGCCVCAFVILVTLGTWKWRFAKRPAQVNSNSKEEQPSVGSLRQNNTTEVQAQAPADCSNKDEHWV